jgi:hypothetical protein
VRAEAPPPLEPPELLLEAELLLLLEAELPVLEAELLLLPEAELPVLAPELLLAAPASWTGDVALLPPHPLLSANSTANAVAAIRGAVIPLSWANPIEIGATR